MKLIEKLAYNDLMKMRRFKGIHNFHCEEALSSGERKLQKRYERGVEKGDGRDSQSRSKWGEQV